MAHAEDLAYLRSRIEPDAFTELAEAIRAGGHIDVSLDAPPDGGMVAVKITRVKVFGGRRKSA